MKVYTEVVIDMETLEVIKEESYDYEGPVALCKGGGSVEAYDPAYNARMASIAEAQQDMAEEYHEYWKWGAAALTGEGAGAYGGAAGKGAGLGTAGWHDVNAPRTITSGTSEYTFDPKTGRLTERPIGPGSQVAGWEAPERLITPQSGGYEDIAKKLGISGESGAWKTMGGAEPKYQIGEPGKGLQIAGATGAMGGAGLPGFQGVTGMGLGGYMTDAQGRPIVSEANLALMQTSAEMGLMPLQAELQGQQMMTDIQLEGYRQQLLPKLYEMATTGIDPEKRASEAQARVQHGHALSQEQFQRQMAGMGISPDSGRYQGEARAQQMKLATDISAARTGAKRYAEEQQWERGLRAFE